MAELSREVLLGLYRRMMRIRMFEERAMELYRNGRIPGLLHPYVGQEAVAAGVCQALRKEDYILSTHRGHGHSLAKGMPMYKIMSELYGKETGACKGIGGSMHATDPEVGVLFSTALVGGGIPIAVGAGLASRLLKKGFVVACFFGDGASNIGNFHEALNMASLWNLPCIFVCENNRYAISVSTKKSTSVERIAVRAASYSMRGVTIDGMDPIEVYKATSEAAERARAGEGPTLIECMTYRFVGHHMGDPGTGYRTREEVEEMKARDPITRLRSLLLGEGAASEAEINAINREAEAELEEAIRIAETSDYLDPETLPRYVYASPLDGEAAEPPQEPEEGRSISYSAALREALIEEMQRDENVIVLGEDIGIYGGIFKVTKGLLEMFGEERVRDTPISENTIVGAALGAALMGMRPVAEIMYMDFLNLAMDQLVNHAAKMRFMTGGQLKAPLVVRTQSSAGRNTGGQHSQFFPAFLMNTPGLKVVAPSTPYDAKGLLKSAIRDDDPVVFIEHGLLYSQRGPVPEKEYLIPIGKASVKRSGRDATIVAISAMVPKAMEAAGMLEERGISAEVIDPRTLAPLDAGSIIGSVKKTGRLVVVDPSCRTAGAAAEIAALIAEEAIHYLDGPIKRITARDTPSPFAPNLTDWYMPSAGRIAEAVLELVGERGEA